MMVANGGTGSGLPYSYSYLPFPGAIWLSLPPRFQPRHKQSTGLLGLLVAAHACVRV